MSMKIYEALECDNCEKKMEAEVGIWFKRTSYATKKSAHDIFVCKECITNSLLMLNKKNLCLSLINTRGEK